jgi:hypothetical protein
MPSTRNTHVDEKYVDRFKKRKCSYELVSHAILDGVEARLRGFDSVKAGRYVRDCKETWAAELIAQPGFELFQQRYESTVEQRAARVALVARDADAAAM